MQFFIAFIATLKYFLRPKIHLLRDSNPSFLTYNEQIKDTYIGRFLTVKKSQTCTRSKLIFNNNNNNNKRIYKNLRGFKSPYKQKKNE